MRFIYLIPALVLLILQIYAIILHTRRTKKFNLQLKKYDELDEVSEEYQRLVTLVHNFYNTDINSKKYIKEFEMFSQNLQSLGGHLQNFDTDVVIEDYKDKIDFAYNLYKKIIPELIQKEREKKFKELNI